MGKYCGVRSGSTARALWGLELGLLSIIDVDFHTAFHVDIAQTPCSDERQQKGIDLLDHYSQMISWGQPHLLPLSQYLTVYAYFARKEFIDQVRVRSSLHIISLLHQDANVALSAINVAKVEAGLSADSAKRKPFSMADVKTRYHNQLLLDRFMRILPAETELHLNKTQVREL